MGISDFREMSRLAKVAQPDICVLTNIGQCHLENLGDRDGVRRAKTEMFACRRPGASIILNGDDDKLAEIKTVHATSFSTTKGEAIVPCLIRLIYRQLFLVHRNQNPAAIRPQSSSEKTRTMRFMQMRSKVLD